MSDYYSDETEAETEYLERWYDALNRDPNSVPGYSPNPDPYEASSAPVP